MVETLGKRSLAIVSSRQFKTHQVPVVQSKPPKIKHYKRAILNRIIILDQELVTGL